MVVRGWGRDEEFLFNGARVSLSQEEKRSVVYVSEAAQQRERT